MKVSLLVTVYNVKESLPVTLASIEEQDYGEIETVIVDGGSTDGTVELIRQFAARMEDRPGFSVRWVSEPDKGLYDAMNKAYRMSTGEVLAVCNDKLCKPYAVSRLVSRAGCRGIRPFFCGGQCMRNTVLMIPPITARRTMSLWCAF